MSANLSNDVLARDRQQMVESQLRARGIADPRLLEAFSSVPRHEFLPEKSQPEAYEDHPLPIGEGQTISQPYIVAVTLDALALRPSQVVLEIGTGSGYQTALLAQLTKYVYSIERYPALAARAQAALLRLGYSNVLVLVGDGSKGLAECAPYDAIVVAAAAPRIPGPLFQQLREGGSMVIPIGPADVQELDMVRKHNGAPMVTVLEGCRFVPLIGEQGYSGGFPPD